MMFMLVESREPFGDDDRSSSSKREPWLLLVLNWLLPWPALIIWLWYASGLLEGLPGLLCLYASVGVAAWRGSRALPKEWLFRRYE